MGLITYQTTGTCATEIQFVVENGIVQSVLFVGGCDGNLKAIARLIEGLPAAEVIAKLKGISCEANPTSCADQLARALEELEK